MARWMATEQNWTPIAVADTTNFTSAGFMALQGGSTTQMIDLWEVYMGGLATSSAPSAMCLARDSTVGGTLSVGNLAACHPSTAALAAPPTVFNTATTKPQRSSTLQLLMLAINAFGGIVRWVFAPGEQITMLGNTASLGELSLSSLNTGSPGVMVSHFAIEPY